MALQYICYCVLFQDSSRRLAPNVTRLKERLLKTFRWTLWFHRASGWEKVSENKGNEGTHTRWKVLIHGPCLGRRRRCIDCAQPQMRNPLGLAAPGSHERTGHWRSAGCSCPARVRQSWRQIHCIHYTEHDRERSTICTDHQVTRERAWCQEYLL